MANVQWSLRVDYKFLPAAQAADAASARFHVQAPARRVTPWIAPTGGCRGLET